jgi:hypothetical protein
VIVSVPMVDTGEKEKGPRGATLRAVSRQSLDADSDYICRARRTAARPEGHPVRQQARLAVRCMTSLSCRLRPRTSRNVDFETIADIVGGAVFVRGVRMCLQQLPRTKHRGAGDRGIGQTREQQHRNRLHMMEAREGIEPSGDGFADRRVTTSPPRHLIH